MQFLSSFRSQEIREPYLSGARKRGVERLIKPELDIVRSSIFIVLSLGDKRLYAVGNIDNLQSTQLSTT